MARAEMRLACQHLEQEQEGVAEAVEVDLPVQVQPVLDAGEDLDADACRFRGPSQSCCQTSSANTDRSKTVAEEGP